LRIQIGDFYDRKLYIVDRKEFRMPLLEKIKSLSQAYCTEIVALRRHLHANPELSYQEYNTVKFVAQTLRTFGIESTEIASTGLLAEIRGKNPDKKTIALRADMDALPIHGSE
jgi:metal-dependent amidase/aminoacylase/carboxypeptidase family protein